MTLLQPIKLRIFFVLMITNNNNNNRSSLKKHVFSISFPGKFVSVHLENSCLFDEQMDPPGKFMSVRGTNGPSWKIIKRLFLEKKNRYFLKLSWWLLLFTI